MNKEKKNRNQIPALKPGDICIYNNEGKFNFTNDMKEAIKNAMKKEKLRMYQC